MPIREKFNFFFIVAAEETSRVDTRTIPVTSDSEQINRSIIASKSHTVSLDTTNAQMGPITEL